MWPSSGQWEASSMLYAISRVIKRKGSAHLLAPFCHWESHASSWTVGMRPPSRWWENVEKGSWHGGFVGQSLPYGPGLLTSKLHLCENIKCLSCLGHCFDRRERWLGVQAPALAAQSHRADRHVEENVSAWGDYLTPVSQSIKQDE